jgi:AcrR family transcriptional regulator
MAEESAVDDLLPRRLPQQPRARRTVERLLATTAALLEEVGVDRVTTNLVAERAGLNIATLYTYFPNKYALLNALALDFAEAQIEAMRAYLRSADPARPWQAVHDELIDVLVEVNRHRTGAVALQRALVAVPELLAAYRRMNLLTARELNRFLRRWGIDLPERRLDLMVLCMGEASAALLDLAESGEGYDADEVVAEMKAMLKGYIALHMARA